MGRNYSSTAVRTSLTAEVSPSATSIPVAALTGYPASFPYVVVVDPDTPSEELVLVTASSGLSLTVDRGIGGTSGVTHTIGAEVRHAVYHEDFQDAADHIDATEAHGASSDLVGVSDAQTLTNKVISGASNTLSNIPQASVTNLVTNLATLTAADASESAARIAADSLRQLTSEKGAASGYASLDGSTKVPFAQLPTGTSSSQVSVGDHTHSVTVGVVGYDVGVSPNTISGAVEYVAETADFDTTSGNAYEITFGIPYLDPDSASNLLVRVRPQLSTNSGSSWSDILAEDSAQNVEIWISNAGSGLVTGQIATVPWFPGTNATARVRLRVERETGSIDCVISDPFVSVKCVGADLR